MKVTNVAERIFFFWSEEMWCCTVFIWFCGSGYLIFNASSVNFVVKYCLNTLLRHNFYPVNSYSLVKKSKEIILSLFTLTQHHRFVDAAGGKKTSLVVRETFIVSVTAEPRQSLAFIRPTVYIIIPAVCLVLRSQEGGMWGWGLTMHRNLIALRSIICSYDILMIPWKGKYCSS